MVAFAGTMATFGDMLSILIVNYSGHFPGEEQDASLAAYVLHLSGLGLQMPAECLGRLASQNACEIM